MRFVSRFQSYWISLKDPIIKADAAGNRETLDPGLAARFTHQDVTPWEREYAKKNFGFSGIGFLEDGVTPEDVGLRVSGFDTATQGWSKQDEEYAIERLLMHQVSGDYAAVEQPRRPAPWKAYDQTAASKIPALAEQTDSVEEAILYEQENKNRPAVIEALEGLRAPVDDGSIVVSA